MKLQVATLCVVVLIVLVGTIANKQNSNGNSSLPEEEENILAALTKGASGSHEENAVKEAAKYKRVLPEQQRLTLEKEAASNSNEESTTNEHSVSKKRASREMEIPEVIDTTVVQENNDFWTLIKRQVASDFAPILALIPAPIKTNIGKMAIESKTMLLTVVYGALRPTLLTASKLLHQASLRLLQLVDVLDQHKQPSMSTNKRNKNRLLERAEKHLKNRKAAKKEVRNEAIAVKA